MVALQVIVLGAAEGGKGVLVGVGTPLGCVGGVERGGRWQEGPRGSQYLPSLASHTLTLLSTLHPETTRLYSQQLCGGGATIIQSKKSVKCGAHTSNDGPFTLVTQLLYCEEQPDSTHQQGVPICVLICHFVSLVFTTYIQNH